MKNPFLVLIYFNFLLLNIISTISYLSLKLISLYEYSSLFNLEKKTIAYNKTVSFKLIKKKKKKRKEKKKQCLSSVIDIIQNFIPTRYIVSVRIKTLKAYKTFGASFDAIGSARSELIRTTWTICTSTRPSKY